MRLMSATTFILFSFFRRIFSVIGGRQTLRAGLFALFSPRGCKAGQRISRAIQGSAPDFPHFEKAGAAMWISVTAG
jgi:hypothetical protein